MSTGRVPLLCSRLLATGRAGGPPRRSCCVAAGVPPPSLPRRWKSSFAPRHGKAVEPVTWEKEQQQEKEGEQLEQQEQPEQQLEQPPAQNKAQVHDKAQAQEVKVKKSAAAPKGAKKEKPKAKEPTVAPEALESVIEAEDKSSSKEEAKPEPEKLSYAAEFRTPDASESKTSETTSAAPNETSKAIAAETEEIEERTRQVREDARQSGPLEAVLHLGPPPGQDKSGRFKQHQPSLSPPPYVHHFDSYTLVKHLQDGGYTQDQAITAMKGIRTLLAQHLDVAQDNLVSKSDVENETYLFSAACSELRAELKNNRRLQDEHTRQQRTHLQHEVDILTQSLNQQSLGLNDMVRGMFNDRKMAVNEEQKKIESAIQQISYKISITLSSDARSEIEGIRGILIRRSVVGIIFMAVLTLGTLQYATYVGEQRRKEEDRRKVEEEELRRDGGKTDHSSSADAAAILAAN